MTEQLHHVQGQIPITGVKQIPTVQTPVRGSTIREQKESLSEGVDASLQQARRVGETLYHKACDACHDWRHYPKLLTTVVLLLTFLTGALTAGGVQKIGIFGGGRHYVSSHWDRETSDAHHALDVVLDHIKHPELYESHHASYVSRAREGLYDLVRGILPSRFKSRELYESAQDTGRDMYDKAGRVIYGRGGIGGGMMDKASDLKEGVMYGARRGVDQAKDVGYGIGHKIGEMAESVKNTFVGDRDRERQYGGGDTYGRGGSGIGGWFGRGDDEYIQRGRRGDDDEYGMAADKLKKVMRSADRD